MPQFADVDGGKIPEMWGHCFLLKVGAAEPVFSYVGVHHAALLPNDISDKPISAAGPNTLIGQASSYYRQVLARSIPITLGGQFVNAAGRTVLYRSILLPLGDEGGKITALFGGANCRELLAETGPVVGS
jgi:hypothetical protein